MFTWTMGNPTNTAPELMNAVLFISRRGAFELFSPSDLHTRGIIPVAMPTSDELSCLLPLPISIETLLYLGVSSSPQNMSSAEGGLVLLVLRLYTMSCRVQVRRQPARWLRQDEGFR